MFNINFNKFNSQQTYNMIAPNLPYAIIPLACSIAIKTIQDRIIPRSNPVSSPVSTQKQFQAVIRSGTIGSALALFTSIVTNDRQNEMKNIFLGFGIGAATMYYLYDTVNKPRIIREVQLYNPHTGPSANVTIPSIPIVNATVVDPRDSQ